MPVLKKLALVTCASNFERHRNIIRAMQQKIKAMGGYALYVITNYGVYQDGMPFSHGEPAIYSLLKNAELDGCILEANLGSNELTEKIAGMMHARHIPVLTINLHVPGIPYLHLESGTAASELLCHLINDHGCRRINLVLNEGNSVVSQSTSETYRKVLKEHHIPYDEKRVYTIPVGLKNGRLLFDVFDRRGVMRDAQAVLCIHDVCAIGLILELEDRGYHVPEDFRICSMNRSANSIAFRPSITGTDRMDRKAAEMACDLMDKLISGQEISPENTYSSEVRYHTSCGCPDSSGGSLSDARIFHRIILNKIEAGNQIGRMMQFNNALEEVDSLGQFSENILKMMEGLDCHSFFCCLNNSDPAYIESNREDPRSAEADPYDESMRVMIGCSERTGEMRDVTFPTGELVPIQPREGDLFILMPIHYITRDYGYMVLMNEMLPVDDYNYRICHDSIGNNIENLHRQMIMKFSLEELDRLHMQDQLTGLYNRFALRRYEEDFVSSPGGYSVAMLDMDDLKGINDTFGHMAGNNAISIAANVIRKAAQEKDIVIRYGGDEFLILSGETKKEKWEAFKRTIDTVLSETIARQRLPYHPGVSTGYAFSTAEHPLTLEKCIEAADSAMYENKKQRKAGRNSI